jgi:hypothetical protein
MFSKETSITSSVHIEDIFIESPIIVTGNWLEICEDPTKY